MMSGGYNDDSSAIVGYDDGYTSVAADQSQYGESHHHDEQSGSSYHDYAEDSQNQEHQEDQQNNQNNTESGDGSTAQYDQSPLSGTDQQTSQEEQPQKLFVGGLSWDTSDETFFHFFQQYGSVVDGVIMRGPNGASRGFGFITMRSGNGSGIDRILNTPLSLDGRKIEVKRAIPKDEIAPGTSFKGGKRRTPLQHQIQQSHSDFQYQQQHPNNINQEYMNADGSTSSSSSSSSSFNDTTSQRTKKIFVGGLTPDTLDSDLREHFSGYGIVSDAMVMVDHITNRPRGFGFVVFDSEEAVDKVVELGSMHRIKDRNVEVKKAVPKRVIEAQGGVPNRGARGNRQPYERGGGGGFDGFDGGFGMGGQGGQPHRGRTRGGGNSRYGPIRGNAYGRHGHAAGAPPHHHHHHPGAPSPAAMQNAGYSEFGGFGYEEFGGGYGAGFGGGQYGGYDDYGSMMGGIPSTATVLTGGHHHPHAHAHGHPHAHHAPNLNGMIHPAMMAPYQHPPSNEYPVNGQPMPQPGASHSHNGNIGAPPQSAMNTQAGGSGGGASWQSHSTQRDNPQFNNY